MEHLYEVIHEGKDKFHPLPLSWSGPLRQEGLVCCISLNKAEEFAGMVKELLGPVMREFVADDSDEKERR